ncbi:PREDICTED: cilia- and flagella-associated protein 43-like [Polistes canadensis]|uniref:cilia- and flagella-associated protein 43-like n=1 Tax=Polistes canadensis TaxID=91411 RepID=UPI000718F1ED|nr:PREDICTED: cilia- and flagella-associated protein 43-like [Polistes canadensis]
MSMENTWIPCWIRGEKIEEIIFIGRDVLAWSTGVHIIFLEISSKKQFIKRCIDQNTGDGACCLSAHATLSIFAFSEKTFQPRILIFDYPTLTKISECVRGSKGGYLATAFTANDYLLSMGYFPHYPMALWSWKTGEKIVEVNTCIRDEVGQILRINQIGPTLVAQMGKTCGKFTDYEIKLPKDEPIRWVDWCPSPSDPILAITDHDGHVYLSNEDGTDVHRIVLSQHCEVCEDYEKPIICWYRSGIILKTTFCQIRYYKKDANSNTWNKVWSIKSTNRPYILVTHPLKNDWLFYYTIERHLMQIQFVEKQITPSVEKYFCYGVNCRYIDFVYPWCHHAVAISEDLKDFIVLECKSGLEIGKISPETIGYISCQASHPDYPLITLTTNQGEVLMINTIDPKNPEIILNMRLYKRPLDLIKFSSSGRSLVVAYKKSGDCFCISLKDNSYTVIGQVRLKRKINDVLLFDSRKGIKLFVLLVTSMKYFVGEQIAIYEVSKEQVNTDEIIAKLNLQTPFRNVYTVPGNPQLIVGTPYLTRHLHVLKLLETTSDIIEIVNAMGTNHNFRCARLFVDRNWLTTGAYDGLIIIRDKWIKKIVGTMMTHHRQDFGSVKGLVNPNANLAVVLGHDGSLVGMRKIEQMDDVAKKLYPVDESTSEKEEKGILADYATLTTSLVSLLNPAKGRLNKFEEEIDLTWVDWVKRKILKEEENVCAVERRSIMKDFLVLKNVVVELLNKNEIVPELERLPVSDFDLDKAEREHAMKVAKDAREDKRLEHEFNCSSMDHIAAWIERNYWDSQKILAKSIFSINGYLEVTNFPLVVENSDIKETTEFAQFQRHFLLSINKPENFQAWRTYTESQIKLATVNPLQLIREDERLRMSELLQDEEREIDQEEIEEQRAFEGMTSHRFIEPSPYYYSQMESYGFFQVILNNHYLMDDCNKLRSYFNKIFNEIYEKKEREMKVIGDKIERIRYIDSELKIMFDRSLPCLPSIPIWHIKEQPERIVRVLDHEVKVKPYISPSQQEILDKQAIEAERIRQLLLADDFRERALMAMMDGVLEVRWEDVIKKDIPKPMCMLIKQPEDYTVEDIREVKKYETDVENLMENRERYKKILEADYVKVKSSLQEGIDKFNSQLNEFYLSKLKLKAAIKQMEFHYVRGRIRNYTRVKNIENYEKMSNEIAKNQQSETTLKEELESFENVQKHLLTPMEAMYNREKILEKKFRSEFPSLGRSSVDLLSRQYKRRPRTNLKNVTMTDLIDLSKCVINRTKLIYLPIVCKEYLKIIDELDLRPSTLPSSIEDNHWEHLTRIRRQRIELELKIKAQQFEIDRSERMVNVYGEKLKKCQSNIRELKQKLNRMKEDRRIFDLNTEIQLVMRMGQVEINLHGSCNETMNAILIPRKIIEEVNVLIGGAGEFKLKAVEHKIDFQKTIRNKEWEHRTLKMRIDDFRDDLRFIQGTNVTREIRIYLKRRARGLREDRTVQRLERELETMQNHFGKSLDEWAKRLEELGKKIDRTKRKNDLLDLMIVNMNVVRCEMEHSRDLINEEKQSRYMDRKMQMIVKRSDLIKELQDNYVELLVMQKEHQLLLLQRYPTLK